MKFNFTNIQEDSITDPTTISMEFDSENVFDVIEYFERFLLACGYTLNGHLNIEEDVNDSIDMINSESNWAAIDQFEDEIEDRHIEKFSTKNR